LGLAPSVAASLVVLLLTAAVVLVLGWLGLGRPSVPHRIKDTSQFFDAIKIGLAVVAGLAAAVGLTVSYRKQRGEEEGAFTARYSSAADQLGHDKAAVRLAGVYAMARLADDWQPQQQTCIDVLCAYLRMPYDPGKAAEGEREVRQSVVRLIRDHLREAATVSWQGRDLDFTEALFDDASFVEASFSGGLVSFDRATFSGGHVSFNGARFIGGHVSFDRATFSGGLVSFDRATFSGGLVSFAGASFSGGQVDFNGASFSGGHTYFMGASFSGGHLGFNGATFSGGHTYFVEASFSGGHTYFMGASFSGGRVGFDGAAFSGGQVDFDRASFSGGLVGFDGARFSGGQVDFRKIADWSSPPTGFPDAAPELLLPVQGASGGGGPNPSS